MPTEVEIAWAAGLFEGEGTITCARESSDKKLRYLQLELTMTDEDVVDKFAAIMGIGRVKAYPYGPHKKIKYVWTTNKFSEVRRIFVMLMPYLGIRRSLKGMSLISEYASSSELRGNL